MYWFGEEVPSPVRAGGPRGVGPGRSLPGAEKNTAASQGEESRFQEMGEEVPRGSARSGTQTQGRWVVNVKKQKVMHVKSGYQPAQRSQKGFF